MGMLKMAVVNEMVERVAKAIWEAECLPVVDEDWQGWQQMVASAAIEAMREPTKEMIMAFSSPNDAELYWRGMINAALGKSES